MHYHTNKASPGGVLNSIVNIIPEKNQSHTASFNGAPLTLHLQICEVWCDYTKRV